MFGSRVLAVACGLVVVGASVWLLQRGESPAAPAVTPAATPAAPQKPPEPALPATAPLQTPESVGIPAADCIVYPDGTRLPPLNGVKKAPPIQFHRMIPFTKVLRKEFDKATGLEWYVHENGARSTTRVQWRNGVQDSVIELSMPAASQPVTDDKH